MNNYLTLFNNKTTIDSDYNALTNNLESFFNFSYPQFFPDYQIIKIGENKFNIEIALPGFDKNRIDVEIKENILTIKSKLNKKESREKEQLKQFEKSFELNKNTEIIGATIKNGLLTIKLENIIPKEQQSRIININ